MLLFSIENLPDVPVLPKKLLAGLAVLVLMTAINGTSGSMVQVADALEAAASFLRNKA